MRARTVAPSARRPPERLRARTGPPEPAAERNDGRVDLGGADRELVSMAETAAPSPDPTTWPSRSPLKDLACSRPTRRRAHLR